jgi:hypothetical protein
VVLESGIVPGQWFAASIGLPWDLLLDLVA